LEKSSNIEIEKKKRKFKKNPQNPPENINKCKYIHKYNATVEIENAEYNFLPFRDQIAIISMYQKYIPMSINIEGNHCKLQCYIHVIRIHIVENILFDCIQCPETMRHTVKQNNDDYEDYNRSSIDIPSEKALVKLHKRVIQDSQNHHRTHAQWNSLMQKAIDLEDVERNEQSVVRKFQRSQHSSPSPPAFVRIVYTPVVGMFNFMCMSSSDF
jgi:hypothetical protein